ncbi:MAG: signal peptide peptidase SppA [Pseudomonadota bacterium]
MDRMRIDDLIDRQKLRRRLSFWRVLALGGALVAVILLTVLMLDPEALGQKSADHIAHVKIESTITEDEDLLKRLETIKESPRAKGLIITMDSPGGSVAGGEALYEIVREIADEKPAITQVGGMAASAGYMISVGTDHIVARKSSIIGSIGVIFQYPNVDGLLEDWGVEMRTIKSTPKKAEPNYFGTPPPGAEEGIRAMILDTYDWFKFIVAEQRGFDEATITRLADGSVFTGRQALELGLVDAIGGMDTAKDWLTEQGLDEDLNIVLYEPENVSSSSLFLGSAMRIVGLEDELAAARRFQDRVLLDGLLSIWHVGNN